MLLTCSYPHIFFIHFFICHGQLLILYEWRILDQLYLLGLHITYYEKMKFQTLVSVTSLIFSLEVIKYISPPTPSLIHYTPLSLSLSLTHIYAHNKPKSSSEYEHTEERSQRSSLITPSSSSSSSRFGFYDPFKISSH